MNVYQVISNKVWGGGEQYVFDLTSQLVKDGEYVEIICRNRQEIISRFRWLEIPISTLPLNGISDWDSAVRMSRILQKSKDTIIHVHNFKTAFTACIARKLSGNKDVKVVVTRHLVKGAKKGFLYNKLYKNVDKIIFVSEIAKKKFLSTNPNINPDKLVVIHNSILAPTYADKYHFDLREQFNIDAEKAILMYHGRLEAEKGVDILIKAASLLDKKKYHLVIAGTGSEEYGKVLSDLIALNHLENNITLLGYVDTIHPLIEQADIGVLPTVVPEALGLSNLEYMMHGKPQVCSNNGAQTEYLEDNKTAILVPPSNDFAIAEALKKLINSEETRHNMGSNAKIVFEEKLSYPRFFEKIMKVYKSI